MICPECGHEFRYARFGYPDGSTDRNVRRPQMQASIIAIWQSIEDGDELGALEIYDALSNDAERAYVYRMLSSEQKAWMRAAQETSRTAGGWDDE